MEAHSRIDPQRIDFFMNQFKALYGNRFAELDQSVIRDFAAMAACLTPEIVTFHLSNLSKQVEANLEEKGKIERSENDSPQIKKKEGKDYVSNYKAQEEVLSEWCQKNGFNQGGYIFVIGTDSLGDETERYILELPASKPIIMGLLSDEIFRGVLIALGYTFKDLGADVQHGEDTHTLGAYTIIEENKLFPFLKNNPVELYKKLGACPYVNYQTGMSPWKIIFDQVVTGMLNTPEILNDAIMGSRLNFEKEMKANTVEGTQGMYLSMWALSDIKKGRSEKRVKQSFSNKLILAPEEATKKFEQMPGIMINNGIFFRTKDSDQIRVLYDSVANDCAYSSLTVNFPLPDNTPTGGSLFDKYIFIFNRENWRYAMKSQAKFADRIVEHLEQLKKEHTVFPHHAFSLFLTQNMAHLKNKDTSPYLLFLINHVQHELYAHDEAELAKLNLYDESERAKYRASKTSKI